MGNEWDPWGSSRWKRRGVDKSKRSDPFGLIWGEWIVAGNEEKEEEEEKQWEGKFRGRDCDD